MNPQFWQTLLSDAFFSALAALGFAVLFNVPVRTLPACVFAGALGHAVRTALVQHVIGIEVATLLAALVIGILGEIGVHVWHTPTTTFSVSGAIPMVPGSFAFRTMMNLIYLAEGSKGLPSIAITLIAVNGIKTALILAALALGISLPRFLFRRRG